jgi:arginine deiminase
VTVFAEVTGAIPTYSLRPGDMGGVTVTAKTAALLTVVAGALGIRKLRTLLTAAGAAVETLIVAATA